MLLTPDFYIYHRHLLLCLSHIAAALTVGMISATGVPGVPQQDAGLTSAVAATQLVWQQPWI